MSIELKPFYHETEVALSDDFILRLVINFRVIDHLEGLLGQTLDEAVGKLATSTAMSTKFLWAMTREHHPDLSIDQVAGIQFAHERKYAVMAALGDLVRRAFNIASADGEGEQSRPPRKPSRGRSSGSSRNGARRG